MRSQAGLGQGVGFQQSRLSKTGAVLLWVTGLSAFDNQISWWRATYKYPAGLRTPRAAQRCQRVLLLFPPCGQAGLNRSLGSASIRGCHCSVSMRRAAMRCAAGGIDGAKNLIGGSAAKQETFCMTHT